MAKPKFRVGQVVSFARSNFIFVKIMAIAEYGNEIQFTVLRDGLRCRCTGSELRPLTVREIGPRPKGDSNG